MEKPDLHKPEVLYVDDINANLLLFEASFEPYFNISLAESGKDGLAVLKEKEISVVVSDQNMPGMSGNELLEIVSSEYPNIMRFMITAYTDYETVVEAVNKGNIYGFFNKPYNVEEVRMSINKALEVRELRLKNQEMIEKLAGANEELKGIDKTKTNFLTSITNEIRTPINRIITAVHMIKDKVDSNELSELLQLLDHSVSKLESFSNAAQKLVKLREAEFLLDSSEVSLNEVIEISVIEKREAFSDANLSFRSDLKESMAIYGEFDLVLTCFNSLLDYVTLHTEEGTEIVFNAEKKDGIDRLSIVSKAGRISNNEKGLLKSYLIQEDSSVEEEISLELILCQQIMLAHGGRVKYEEMKDGSIRFDMLFSKKKRS